MSARQSPERQLADCARDSSKSQCKAVAEIEDKLLPIRLDIDEEPYKVRDTFIWNVADETITPEMFARTICEDFGLPLKTFEEKISARIREAIAEAQDAVFRVVRPSTPEFDADWWGKWRTGLASRSILAEDEDDESDADSDGPLPAEDLLSRLGDMANSQDVRIKIQLDIISGNMNLTDTFEWDLLSPVTPEDFAEAYAADLGLNGEFKTAIIHDLREQILNYVRSLLIAQYRFDGRPIWDPELAAEILPPVIDPIRRDDASIFAATPVLNMVTEADIAMSLAEQRLPARNKKARGTRGRRGALNLPDREPIKTIRTRISDGVDEQGMPLVPAAAPKEPPPVFRKEAPPISRRAAAAAARANISSMANETNEDIFEDDVPTRPHRRTRVDTATPAPATAVLPPPAPAVDPSPAPPPQTISETRGTPNGVKQEEGYDEPPAPPMPREWTCRNCGRPESELEDGVKYDGSLGAQTLCGHCFHYQQQATQEQIPPSATATAMDEDDEVSKPVRRPMLRIDSPVPFQDVASPDSSDSSGDEAAPASASVKVPDSALSQTVSLPSPSAAAASLQRVVSSGSQQGVAPPRPQAARSVSGQHVSGGQTNSGLLPTNSPSCFQFEPPPWLPAILANFRAARPHENIEAVYRGKLGAGGSASDHGGWRIKCLDW